MFSKRQKKFDSDFIWKVFSREQNCFSPILIFLSSAAYSQFQEKLQKELEQVRKDFFVQL